MNYSNEQIRAAILRAADRIEGGAKYNWWSGYINADGGSDDGCGCMLHYVGQELSMRRICAKDVAKEIGLSDSFLSGYHDHELYLFANQHGWDKLKAADAVKILRAFADHKFPAVNPDHALIPWSACVWQPKEIVS